MRPFLPRRADGSLRHPPPVVPKLSKQRSRETNGGRSYDKRGSRARRISDLAASYLAGFAAPDEAAIGLARAAALAAVRLERLEARAVADDETIDDFKIVRLAGVLGRTLQALASLKAKAQPQSERAGTLREHLGELAARKALRRSAVEGDFATEV